MNKAAVLCIECGAAATLVDGAAIYPHRPDLHAKRFWLCACGAYCGCHGGTDKALGSPAGPETRRARGEARAAFDPLWRAKQRRAGLPKSRARDLGYKWLAEQLGMTRAECHIAMMSAADARRVVEICSAIKRPRAA